jgi:hypothetical protein
MLKFKKESDGYMENLADPAIYRCVYGDIQFWYPIMRGYQFRHHWRKCPKGKHNKIHGSIDSSSVPFNIVESSLIFFNKI